MASKFQYSAKSVRNVIKYMSMKSVNLSKTFLLTDAVKQKRRHGCKTIFNPVKTKGPVKVFIDEKIFRVDGAANSRNYSLNKVYCSDACGSLRLNN